jgi:hypothetical protein
MKKLLLSTSVFIALFSSNLYANPPAYGSEGNDDNSPYYNAQEHDNSNDRGGNSPYYNAQERDDSNDRGGNSPDYNASDNTQENIYGDDNSYRNSDGMIINN